MQVAATFAGANQVAVSIDRNVFASDVQGFTVEIEPQSAIRAGKIAISAQACVFAIGRLNFAIGRNSRHRCVTSDANHIDCAIAVNGKASLVLVKQLELAKRQVEV